MAVATDSSNRAPSLTLASNLIVCASPADLRRRIELALSEGVIDRTATAIESTELLLSEVLLGESLDPDAIVVFACEVDRPRHLTQLRRLRRGLAEVGIVTVSPVATGTGIRRALDAGADAVVFEPELESTLAVAVSAVASGQSVVPRKLRAGFQRPSFSHRERQVLTCVADGYTNAQIADELYLSESTIKSHLSSAFAKLGVRSRKEAAALFYEINTQGAGE